MSSEGEKRYGERIWGKTEPLEEDARTKIPKGKDRTRKSKMVPKQKDWEEEVSTRVHFLAANIKVDRWFQNKHLLPLDNYRTAGVSYNRGLRAEHRC